MAVVSVDDILFSTPVFLVYAAQRTASLVQDQFIKFMDIPRTKSLIESLAEGQIP